MPESPEDRKFLILNTIAGIATLGLVIVLVVVRILTGPLGG